MNDSQVTPAEIAAELEGWKDLRGKSIQEVYANAPVRNGDVIILTGSEYIRLAVSYANANPLSEYPTSA